MKSTKESQVPCVKKMEVSEQMKISEVIKPEDVTIDAAASSKATLLQQLSENAARVLGISERDVFAALQRRESLGSTGIGKGIAIPHAPVAGIDAPFGQFVRLTKPIEFEAIDEEPVDIVCLILIPSEGQSTYLKLLSNIARQLRSKDALRKIRSAVDREQVYSAITECEP
jgi:PTS system nitrogen regulatory IIA component